MHTNACSHSVQSSPLAGWCEVKSQNRNPPGMALGEAPTQGPDYFAGLGCGFLPFDSFFLSLLPTMLTP